MSNIKISNLAFDQALDSAAMSKFSGAGLWGRIKRRVKRSARWVGRKAKSKYRRTVNNAFDIYSTAKALPGMLYSSPRLVYRSLRETF